MADATRGSAITLPRKGRVRINGNLVTVLSKIQTGRMMALSHTLASSLLRVERCRPIYSWQTGLSPLITVGPERH